ncbi:MAG: hypothetical protein WD431_18505 [Cyclobacteriaceae bacterium]
MTIPHLSDPITFNGVPNEEVWEAVDPVPLTTYFPEDGSQTSERSDIRFAHDAVYLYVGARLYDSEPSKIQSTTFRRNFDNLSSDSFALILDTFNNNETAVAFFVAPTGARSYFLQAFAFESPKVKI